ncbi:MAG: hypothetical protein J6O40_05305 [Ruminococcus sp.]|nr:hypothetical protein [Ruminococcus sp.]
MKKAFIPIISAAFALSLAACGNTEESSSKKATAIKPSESSSLSLQEGSSSEVTTTAAQQETTTTTTTTAETTTTPSPEQEPRFDLSSLMGVWYVDGDKSAAKLKISVNGHFESYYASGSLEYEGEIKLQKADLNDGSGECYYYCFYKDGGEAPVFYVPTDAARNADDFTTKGAVTLHFAMTAAEPAPFVCPEGMPFDYSTINTGSVSSGTDLHVNSDGTFEGLYISYVSDEDGFKTTQFCHFAGSFAESGTGRPLNSDNILEYHFKVADIYTIPGIPDKDSAFFGYVDENMTDIGESASAGLLQNGERVHLYLPGSEHKKLAKEFSEKISEYLGGDEVLSDYYLFGEGSQVIFVSQ